MLDHEWWTASPWTTTLGPRADRTASSVDHAVGTSDVMDQGLRAVDQLAVDQGL
jgi:hypothetical protein